MIEALKSFFFYVYVALVGILTILLILLAAYLIHFWQSASGIVRALILLAVAGTVVLVVYLTVPDARTTLEKFYWQLIFYWNYLYSTLQELFKLKWAGALLLALLPLYFLFSAVDNSENV